MKTNNHNKKMYFLTFSLLFVLVGIYNSVVINSESTIMDTEVKFVKRLDEVYGVTIPGRHVAMASTWQKIVPTQKNISPKKEKLVSISNFSQNDNEPLVETQAEAAVMEELNLSLIEVTNPKKWQNSLNNSQFSGSLVTNNGVIEGMSVSLPNDEGFNVSFSELTGNVFEYDIDGELYSGMMYQVDQSAYMVTLTNGPLEGTRLRFSSLQPDQEQQINEQILVENNVDIGNFGNQDQIIQEELVSQDKMIQNDGGQAQGFNL